MTLKQELLNAGLGLCERDFNNNASDLYVVEKPGLRAYLKEKHPQVKFSVFMGQGPWKGLRCLDIMFGYMPEHYEATKGK